ncbi:hypothetical protein DFH94DRAFT_624919 [Russula ochroleuca]|uniref:DUF6535 domain-containing protein n=1 Tax=Russula ochroleuca TaxID=152965 RepID=A0A9P5N3F7_9AGAM|nr:hypothetical protein DFH94DRAFT_624919 [Russula ochroleuca]
MYLESAIAEDKNIADKIAEDEKMVESWKKDADRMLVFTGIFSAAVAALLVVSVPSIQQNPQDISAFYLAHIYQSSLPNGSQAFIPSSLSDPTKPFIPPTSGAWVNGLWFLSLVINLSCALLATLIQQWARRYLMAIYPRQLSSDSLRRSRISAFYMQGTTKLIVPWMIEAGPLLLHASLFLFFAGLSVFLFGLQLTIFKVVTTWIALCTSLYSYLTFMPFMPFIGEYSPYYTPLYTLVFSCFRCIR